jgi:hypothetical protein
MTVTTSAILTSSSEDGNLRIFDPEPTGDYSNP